MTNDDDRLRRLFDGIRFVDEPRVPPSSGSVDDDVARGRRGLRRRRLTTWGSAALGTAVIVSGVAVAAPNLDLGGDDQVPVAGETSDEEADAGAADEGDGESASGQTSDPSGTATSGPAAEISPCPSEPPPEPSEDVPSGFLAFENTRQCLLETAVKHFDPEHEHLPEQSTSTQSGGGRNGARVGTKLGWTVPGEDGLGMVQVAVTTPGYADGDYATYDMPGMMVCSTSPDVCRSEPVPGTDEEVLVVEDDPEYDWSLAVMHERADGSMVSVAVSDLFGNNSVVPVSEVDITLEQAIGFVTDPALQVDEDEVAQSREQSGNGIRAQGSENPDYSSDEVVPAPEIREMADEEAQAAVETCMEGIPTWSGFEAEFGVWMTTPSGEEEPLVIASRGDEKMECRDGGDAALFGAPEVKGSPYLRGPVAYNNMKFGRYVSDVDRVTVQPSGGPAYEAAMKNGYWFLPKAHGDFTMSAIRGYDASGERIYDSTAEDRDREDGQQCYTDPEGNEVVIYDRRGEVPPVEDCKPALEWDHE